jgi:hypothetical protein
MKRSILLPLGLAFLLGNCMAGDKKGPPPDPAEKKDGKPMEQSAAPLPFNLKPSDLPGAKILVSQYSPKTGAGKQQIEIHADGTVRVIRTVNYEAPEEVLMGKVTQPQALVLFTYIESENFLQLDEDYKTGKVSARRQLELTLPGQTKSVWTDYEMTPPAFNRIVGAIKLLAGIAVPKSLGHDFLTSL